jgi:hypothetical protein
VHVVSHRRVAIGTEIPGVLRAAAACAPEPVVLDLWCCTLKQPEAAAGCGPRYFSFRWGWSLQTLLDWCLVDPLLFKSSCTCLLVWAGSLRCFELSIEGSIAQPVAGYGRMNLLLCLFGCCYCVRCTLASPGALSSLLRMRCVTLLMTSSGTLAAVIERD